MRTYYGMAVEVRDDYTGRWYKDVVTRTREGSLHNGDWIARGDPFTVRASNQRDAQRLAEKLVEEGRDL